MGKEFLDRNLALEAVRVTEAAALSSSFHMGRGNEKAADQGNERAKDRFEILMLLAINQAVEKGKFPYQGKLDYMTRLEPWQIKEANNYFK